MQLYFREKQLALLEQIFDSVGKGSNFVLLFGKRKVGKTTLIAEHLRRRRGAYLTISHKSTLMQLSDISDYLKSINFTDGYIPSFRSWKEFFEFIFYISKEAPVNLALDEFHNFERVDSEVFEEIKNLWDKYAGNSYLNLIVMTSDQDFIQRYFYNPSSPLYQINRNTLKLTPFVFSEVAKIIQMNDSMLSLDEIIKIYLIFGGLPKYYALIDQFQLWNYSLPEILRELVFKKFAPLGFELKEMLVNEFSRNNAVYLSILQSIAAGAVTVTDISKAVAIPPTSVIKYLTELEKKKNLVKKKNPLGTIDPARSKYGHYYLNNYFENFWFRFIQPNIISYEMGEYDRMMEMVNNQLPIYIQQRMRLIVKELLWENASHPMVSSLIGFPISEIGETWNRDARLDIVVRGDEFKRILLGDIFTSPLQMSPQGVQEFQRSVASIMKMHPNYQPDYLIVSWDNPTREFNQYLELNNIKHIMLQDVLMLTNYRSKFSKAVRVRAERVRTNIPVAKPETVRKESR